MEPTRFVLKMGFMTAKGPVFIAQGSDRNYYVMWRGQPVDMADSLVAAIDNVGHGVVPTAWDGTDLATLDISPDIGEWLPASEFLSE